MKCYFCQNECEPCKDPSSEVGQWSCSRHPMEVHHFRYVYNEDDGPPDFLHFSHEHKNKTYIVWLTLRQFDSGTYRTPNYIPCNIQYHADKGLTHLVDFSFIPKITPDNIAQKLPIYLTFL